MPSKRIILGLCAAALTFASAAYAAPIAKMSCASSSQSTNFDITYFSIGTSDANEPVTGTGSGAGRADALLPLTIHTGFAHVEVLGEAYGNGVHFSTCTLKFTDKSGGRVAITLNNVAVQTLRAVGKDATEQEPSDTYVEAVFTFTGASVSMNGGTLGGSGAAAWNLGKNQ